MHVAEGYLKRDELLPAERGAADALLLPPDAFFFCFSGTGKTPSLLRPVLSTQAIDEFGDPRVRLFSLAA
jgi:hypothetical protein